MTEAPPRTETTALRARVRRAAVVPVLGTLVAGHLTTRWLHWYCPIAQWTHHPCPTCGLSRAVASLLTGHVRYALHEQPLVVVVLPVLSVVAALELGTYVWTGELGRWTRKRAIARTLVVLAIALFLVWVSRFFGMFGGPVLV